LLCYMFSFSTQKDRLNLIFDWLGLVGNTLVIYVVLRFSKMHTVTNMYILNLAVADECFVAGIPFLITTMAMAQWPFGAIMCKIYYITTSINQFSSTLFLFILAGKCFKTPI
jgi:hypothetical protein